MSIYNELSLNNSPCPDYPSCCRAIKLIDFIFINENLYSPHMVAKYNKNSNGTIKKENKKVNGNALSILL